MVSQQSTYRHLSPSRPRRQTLAVFHSPPRQAGSEVKYGSEASTALNRKWVHRSLGDLTSDHSLHVASPVHQSSFYQDLYQKYPHAFQHRLEERETTRRLFNARPQVRFDDEHNFEGQHNSVHADRIYSHLTNWDREVGHYFKNRSHFRDCMTSAGTSEISGPPTRARHFNSETLNKLLNEQSPLRRKFQKDVPSTRSELDIQDYFLEKSRARSRQRRKHCRILQRKIEKSDSENVEDKENSKSKTKPHHSYENWTHHLHSDKGNSSENVKLPAENRFSHKRVDVNSVVADTDLKIDTLLEKISLKMSSPESLPDSAIDVDTPSVQSFVSAGKGGNLEMQLAELPDLTRSAENSFGSARECENGADSRQKELKGSQDIDEDKTRIETTDFHIDHEISEIDTVIETNNYSLAAVNENNNARNFELPDENVESSTGLLQIYKGNGVYSKQNETVTDVQAGSWEVMPDNYPTADQAVETATLETDVDDTSESNTLESLSSDVQSVQSCVERPVLHIDASQDVPQHTLQKYHNKDSDVDSGIGQSSTGTDIRERGRSRGRTPNMIQMKADQSVLPLRSEVDCCILDEVDLMQSDHQVSLQRDGLNDVDDTADASLNAAEITPEEIKIAEKYRRTRSPSPYILTNARKSGQYTRPNSAPFLINRHHNIKIIDISISDKPKSKVTENSKVAKNTPGQNAEHVSAPRKQSGDEAVSNSRTVESREKFMPMSDCQRCSVSSISSSETYASEQDNIENYVADLPREFVEEINEAGATGMINDPGIAVTDTGNTFVYKKNYAIDDESDKDIHFGRTDITEMKANDSSGAESTGGGYERRYKPAGLSPRVNEKRLKIRNKMKSKSDIAVQEASSKQVIIDNRHNISRDGVQDDKGGLEAEYDGAIKSERGTCENFDGNANDDRHKASLPAETASGVTKATLEALDPNRGFISDTDVYRNNQTKNLHGRLHETETVKVDIDSKMQNEPTKAKYIDDRRYTSSVEIARDGKDPFTSPETDMQHRAPPVKPARTKHKKMLPQGQTTPGLQSDSGSIAADGVKQIRDRQTVQHIEVDVIEKIDEAPPGDKQVGKDRQLHTDQNLEERQPSVADRSNLENSKKLSASKASLLDKVGTLKTATKGKFKKLRKAMSLERGIDNCGVDMNPDPYRSHDTKGDHSGQKKMKKAPSLKSLSNLFGRIKKKKGKWKAEEVEVESYQEPSKPKGTSGQLSSGKRQQWTSCHTLSPTPLSTSPAPIGKLLEVNPDGSQLIQLFKPSTGPIGFFIAKGTDKYQKGIFVSRLAESRSEVSFGGLLGVGDEILEVNGHFVRDLSQDAVYKLISACPVVVLKVLPFIARKDV